jgi:FixJ family two-component response regulator
VTGIVHVVDDDASFRTAVERRLKKAGYEVATYPSAQQLLERLPDGNASGCILLDVQIPGLSGPELQVRLKALGSSLPIVFLTGHADIERALAHHVIARAQRSRLDVMRAQIAAFTPRERQVFELVVRGKINKQIAHELGTTERTIKAHRQQVMEKAKVQSLAELVSIAEQLGMLAQAEGR